MNNVQGYAVISSTIYQEEGFKDYRFVASKAASELGFCVKRNSEDTAATQKDFEDCMINNNPVFIAIIGEKLTPLVKREYELAIKLGLPIITFIKASGDKKAISESTSNNLRAISKYIYEKDCSTFLSCEELYESVKQRLVNHIKSLREQKIKLLHNRPDVYPTTTDMITETKKLVILCQNSSTLLLGPRDDGIETQCYNSLINWLKTSDSNMTFIHIFSKEKTQTELTKTEYSKKRIAKENVIDILTSNEVKVNVIFKTAENLQPCTIVDNNILFSLDLGVNTHYVKLPGIFMRKEDTDTIINLLKNTGDFYCSNENKKENKKLINALFKI